MKLETVDLKIIRELEVGGRLFPEIIVEKLDISKDMFMTRLSHLESSGLIKNFKATTFVPALLGDNWSLGGGFGITTNLEPTSENLIQRVPYLIELWQNLSFPFGVGPNLSFLFYCQDFQSSVQYLKESKIFEYLEIYKLRDYSFPIPISLSIAEKKLLNEIVVNPTVNLDTLAKIINQDAAWIQEKINRLISNPFSNPAFPAPPSEFRTPDVSILQILPEFNWQVCENFCHVHFIVENSNSSVQSANSASSTSQILLPFSDLSPVLSGQPFRERYYQFETDIWGFDQLINKLNIIYQTGINTKGLIIAESNRIINHWVPNLLI